MISLEGKVALVTGASRGIGQAIAIKMASKSLCFWHSNYRKGADPINAYFEEEKIEGKGIVLDVTNSEQVDSLMSYFSDNEQNPSILVNNAGITADNLLLRMDDDEWYKVIETNLNSIYRMTKACLKPMFRARWGRIISIGSVVGSVEIQVKLIIQQLKQVLLVLPSL